MTRAGGGASPHLPVAGPPVPWPCPPPAPAGTHPSGPSASSNLCSTPLAHPPAPPQVRSPLARSSPRPPLPPSCHVPSSPPLRPSHLPFPVPLRHDDLFVVQYPRRHSRTCCQMLSLHLFSLKKVQTIRADLLGCGISCKCNSTSFLMQTTYRVHVTAIRSCSKCLRIKTGRAHI